MVALDSILMFMSLTVRRAPRTGYGFVEPCLDVSDAIPLHMAQIPAGTFVMGSPDDESERSDSEGPQHEVTILKFFMGRYPITQAQYEQVIGANPATSEDTERFVAPNKPVINVSWEDAVIFCDRLSELTHRHYCLPTEAEWEYACRAGKITPFSFGKTLTTDVANYYGNDTYADGPEGEFRNALTPVNHFNIANAFGLCDMHGNVWEWCEDHWHDNYEGAPSDGSAWFSSNKNESRILRGGSWDAYPRKCRSAYRNVTRPGNRNNYIGFRVCCSPPRALR